MLLCLSLDGLEQKAVAAVGGVEHGGFEHDDFEQGGFEHDGVDLIFEHDGKFKDEVDFDKGIHGSFKEDADAMGLQFRLEFRAGQQVQGRSGV